MGATTFMRIILVVIATINTGGQYYPPLCDPKLNSSKKSPDAAGYHHVLEELLLHLTGLPPSQPPSARRLLLGLHPRHRHHLAGEVEMWPEALGEALQVSADLRGLREGLGLLGPREVREGAGVLGQVRPQGLPDLTLCGAPEATHIGTLLKDAGPAHQKIPQKARNLKKRDIECMAYNEGPTPGGAPNVSYHQKPETLTKPLNP